MDTSRIDEYIRKGAKDRTWYADTEALFRELYGPPPMLTLVTKLFAATSINSSLKSNIRLFRRALYEIENNLPQGKYLPVMAMQIDAIRNGRPMSGRKINSFAAAMSGDVNAVVVDIWLLRAFGENNRYMRSKRVIHPAGHEITVDDRVREGGATSRQYDIIEAYVRHEAKIRGFDPREVSAMIWGGIRGGVTRYDQYLRHQLYSMYEV